MFVLDSTDAKSDAARFKAEGIGAFEPFFFERKGRRPDGTETDVAFTLCLCQDPQLPNASFFRCRQHFPGNFWNPDFQTHPNTAAGIQKVSLAVAKPSDHAVFLSHFTNAEGVAGNRSLHYALDKGGQLTVESCDNISGFSSFEIAVSDLTRAEDLLKQAAVPVQIA